MSRPLVSIIVPTYNSAATIDRCLESLAVQTFRDFEVVVVDGLSNDETLGKVAAFERRFEARVISERDRGIYDAMNKGIAAGRGEWLFFLGSDDALYDADVLQKIFGAGCHEPYDVIYGSVYHEDLDLVYDREFDHEKICRQAICHQAIFYRKRVFEQFGNYNVDMRIYAHVYLDKILFASGALKWKFVDLIIARYEGRGASRYQFDLLYWSSAERLLLSHFRDKVSQAVIYKALVPYPQWHQSLDSLKVAVRILLRAGSAKGLYYWFWKKGSLPFVMVRQKLKKLAVGT